MRPAANLLLGVIGIAACESREENTLARVVDSTADTVFIRIRGAVPDPAVRHLIAEVRIAPKAEDTTLFTQIGGFKVDWAGRFLVYDQPTHSMLLFERDGRLLRRIGREGAGPGEFRSQSGVAVLGDTGFAVWDPRNGRVSFFSAEGDFKTTWMTPSSFFTTDGLVIDRSGTLYLKRPVTAPREGEILGRIGLVRLAPAGAPVDSAAPPDMPVLREGYLATSPDGRGRSSTRSELAPGYHWAWHPDGYFVVAHGGNYEIVLARPGQKPLAILREAPRVVVPEEERNEEKAWITWSMQQTQPSWSWSGPPIPEFKAPLRGLFIARDGRIWALVPRPSERIPEDELDTPRSQARPVRRFRTPLAYEVFTPDGRFVGRVHLPPRTGRIMEADGDYVWAVQRDEDDLPALVRFRIEPAF